MGDTERASEQSWLDNSKIGCAPTWTMPPSLKPPEGCTSGQACLLSQVLCDDESGSTCLTSSGTLIITLFLLPLQA